MIVTTGARNSKAVSSASLSPTKPISTSASETRFGVWPNSCTMSSAVSASTHVGDLMHRAFLHQILDEVDGALRHAVRQFLNGDGFGDDHLARDLLARLLRYPSP